MPARKSVLSVLAIETRCAISTLGLIARRKLGQPNDLVDSHIEFADGSVSRIYRETTMRDLETTPQVMLAVRFRLRFIGSSRLGPCPLPIRVPLQHLVVCGASRFSQQALAHGSDDGLLPGDLRVGGRRVGD